jgi:hypothetical protein
MTSQLAGIEPVRMELFREIVTRRDPTLMKSVLKTQNPTLDERVRVESILSDELMANLTPPEYDFNEHADQVYALIEQFLTAYPIDEA